MQMTGPRFEQLPSTESTRHLVRGSAAKCSWVEDRNGDGFHFQTPFRETPQVDTTHRRWKSHLWQTLRLILLIAIWAAFLGLQLAKDRFATCSGPYFGM